MNNYKWMGINTDGKKISGQIAASGAAELKMKLRSQGITPLNVKLISNYSTYFQQSIKQQNIIDFLQQLATLISSQIPIVTALEIIIHGQNHTKMIQLLTQIKNSVTNGIGLGVAFAQYPHYFNELICALITAGEETGTLEEMLNRLVSYLQSIVKIKNNTLKILLYPFIVIIITCIVTLFLLIIAVPQFENLFNNLNAPLPPFTQFLMLMSQLIQSYGLYCLLLFAALLATFRLCWLKSKRFVNKIQFILLKLPFIGSVLQKIIVVRISHTLATIVTAGIPLVQALQISSHIAGNDYYADAIRNAKNNIIAGTPLNLAFATSRLFPATMIQMIAIGEESGTLDKMLFKITDWYSEQNEQLIAKISILLEPMIMLILALVIGSIIVAMYLPIFKLGTVI